MKRAHFDVEEDGFYGAYWARKGTVNACAPKYRGIVLFMDFSPCRAARAA